MSDFIPTMAILQKLIGQRTALIHCLSALLTSLESVNEKAELCGLHGYYREAESEAIKVLEDMITTIGEETL
jgi:hypothetical protein